MVLQLDFKKFRILIIILFLLIVLNASFYFFGIAKVRAVLIKEEKILESLRDEIKSSRELEKVKREYDDFRRRLPVKDDITNIIERLSKTAKNNNLVIPGITYSHQEMAGEELIRLSISFQIKGDYKGIRRFIHDMEKGDGFLSIESLSLSSVHGDRGGVNLQVKMATLLRR